jgi:hypothetical protein
MLVADHGPLLWQCKHNAMCLICALLLSCRFKLHCNPSFVPKLLLLLLPFLVTTSTLGQGMMAGATAATIHTLIVLLVLSCYCCCCAYITVTQGQGMMAGATAVPLTPPEHQVLFKPTAETTTPSDPGALKPLAQQDDSLNGSAATTTAAAPAARPAAADGVGGATIPMQPIPTSPAAATAARQLPMTAQAAQKQPHQPSGVPLGTVAAVGPTCRTLPQAQQQQHQQMQMQSIEGPQMRHRKTAAPSAAAAAAGVAAAPGKLMPVSKPEMDAILSKTLDRQQHQRSYTVSSSSRQTTAARGSRYDYSRGSSSSSRGIKGWMRRKWQSGSERVANWLEHAAAWVLSMLWLGLCWVGRLLLTPLTAVFGPWYRYNR